MSASVLYTKTVAEFAPFGRNLAADIAKAGASETIASVVWSVPAGLTSSNPGNDDSAFWIWLAGGTLDATYTVTALVTYSSGRKIEPAFDVRIIALRYA